MAAAAGSGWIRWALIGGGIAAAGLYTAVSAVDDQILARAAASRAAAFGLPLEAESSRLTVFPWPALELTNVRLGRKESPPFVRAEQARLGLALLPLLRGEPVLQDVALERPFILLPASGSGLPDFSLAAARMKPARGSEGETADAESAARIDRLTVSEGRIDAGRWSFTAVELSGSQTEDGALRMEGEANLEGIAGLSGLEIEVGARDAAGPSWSLKTELPNVDLGGVRTRLGLGLALAGNAKGSLAASGRGFQVEDGTLALDAYTVDLRTGAAKVQGAVRIAAEVGSQLQIDLGSAELALGADGPRKPSGEPMTIRGALKPGESWPVLGALTVEHAAGSLPGSVALTPERVITLGPGLVDLAQLKDWWKSPIAPTEGRIEIEQLTVNLDRGGAAGSGRLDNVKVKLPDGSFAVGSGPLTASGSRISGRELSVSIGGEALGGSVDYDLVTSDFSLDANLRGVKFSRFGELVMKEDVEGVMYGRIRLAGRPELASLRGSGNLTVQNGVLPRLAPFRQAGSERKEGAFDRLTADFTLEDTVITIPSLELRAPTINMQLEGEITLADQAANLRGSMDLQLPPEMGGGRRTIPNVLVGGPLSSITAGFVLEEDPALQEMARQMMDAMQPLRKNDPRIGTLGTSPTDDQSLPIDGSPSGQAGDPPGYVAPEE